MMNYEITKKIVEKGESKTFENWNNFTGISKENFLEAIKWLCEDPMVVFGKEEKATREIACESDGSITKLKRVYDAGGSFVGVYRLSDHIRHYGSNVTLNIMDRV